jgi:hypothetical protein
VSNVVADPNPAALNTSVTVTATADDSGTGNSNIASAGLSTDGGSTWQAMSASDGYFDDSPAENLTATIGPFASAQVVNLCVRATDAAREHVRAKLHPARGLRPSAGFVTGGGWIDSPTGACQDASVCTDTTGKATFGFVSRYKKGATAPDGNTQFVFHASGLDFSSTSYQWLVVNQHGGNAQFKGDGTINGSGDYQFMIWATDGSRDASRIQITNGNTTVYDNGVQQPIGGGSIIVHK